MSYYFCIVGTKDNSLFELEFGTSKQGGDGVARFSAEARDLNPFLLHASLDIVDEMQWTSNQMYLKRIDHFASSHISAFLTPASVKFLLLHLPHPPNTAPTSVQTPTSFSPFGPYTTTPLASSGRQTASGSSSSSSGGGSGSSSIANNATSPQTEEAIRQFFGEVFEVWLKALMNPFCGVDTPLVSPVFRARVVAAGKKYL